MFKKILPVIFSLFLIWMTYGLIQSIANHESLNLGASLYYSALINLYITGIFAFAGFALPTQILIPQNYFSINNAAFLQKLYLGLKVDLFRMFLLTTFWLNKKQRKNYFSGRRDGLNHFIESSKNAETGHLAAFIALTIVGIYFLFSGHLILFGSSNLINIILNFYPIILQRYHRMRIDKIRSSTSKG